MRPRENLVLTALDERTRILGARLHSSNPQPYYGMPATVASWEPPASRHLTVLEPPTILWHASHSSILGTTCLQTPNCLVHFHANHRLVEPSWYFHFGFFTD